MKKLLLVSSICFLSACGGSDSSSNDESFPSVDKFSITPYSNAANSLTSSGLAGTWVGVISSEKKRYNMTNAQVNERSASSVLTAFIIRPRENEYEEEGDYEIANCSGSFEALTVADQGVQSQTFYAVNDSKNSMGHRISGTRYVPLSEYAGYSEDFSYSLSYRRVSDSTERLGEMTFNWSDVKGEASADIFCGALENFPDQDRRVVFSSDDSSLVQLSNFISHPLFDAYIVQEGHEETIINFLTIGEQSFSFIAESDEMIQLEYVATSSSGLTATGQAKINLLP